MSRFTGGEAGDFFALPTCGREDLAREPWSFVPDNQPLGEMVVYDTSGTSSRPIYIMSHPEVSSMYLPALRTALEFHGGLPALVDFEGRQPTIFVNTRGRIINNIDVTHALKPFPIGQFSLHQNADRSLVFRVRESRADEAEVQTALLNLFGPDQVIETGELIEDLLQSGKVLQYTSDISELSVEGSEIQF